MPVKLLARVRRWQERGDPAGYGGLWVYFGPSGKLRLAHHPDLTRAIVIMRIDGTSVRRYLPRATAA